MLISVGGEKSRSGIFKEYPERDGIERTITVKGLIGKSRLVKEQG